MASILRRCGCLAVGIEKKCPYYLPTGKADGSYIRIRYRVDVVGRKGDRRIAIEVDGYVGHKSERAIRMDKLRTRRLCEKYGFEKVYRFTFKQLAAWTDQEVAEEMHLTLLKKC
jgi:hypothetical protein